MGANVWSLATGSERRVGRELAANRQLACTGRTASEGHNDCPSYRWLSGAFQVADRKLEVGPQLQRPGRSVQVSA